MYIKYLGLLTIDENGYLKEITFPIYLGRKRVTLCWVGSSHLIIKERQLVFKTNQFCQGVIFALGLFNTCNINDKKFSVLKPSSAMIIEPTIDVVVNTNSMILEFIEQQKEEL